MSNHSKLRFLLVLLFAAFATAALVTADIGALAQNANGSTTGDASAENSNANMMSAPRRGRRGRRVSRKRAPAADAATAEAAAESAATGDASQTGDTSQPGDLSGDRQTFRARIRPRQDVRRPRNGRQRHAHSHGQPVLARKRRDDAQRPRLRRHHARLHRGSIYFPDIRTRPRARPSSPTSVCANTAA